MIRFKEIENLIEREIIKLSVPAELGESPKWNPVSEKRPYKRNFKKPFPRKKTT